MASRAVVSGGAEHVAAYLVDRVVEPVQGIGDSVPGQVGWLVHRGLQAES